MGERLAEALAGHMDRSPGVDLGDDHLVFTSGRGAPLRRSTLGDYWTKWKPADTPARGWHVCRHTYASVLIDVGESIVTVQRRLGHASAQETLGTYAHLMPSEVSGFADAWQWLQTALSGSSAKQPTEPQESLDKNPCPNAAFHGGPVARDWIRTGDAHVGNVGGGPETTEETP